MQYTVHLDTLKEVQTAPAMLLNAGAGHAVYMQSTVHPSAVLLHAGAGHPVYMQSTVHLAALREASRSSSDPPGAPSNTAWAWRCIKSSSDPPGAPSNTAWPWGVSSQA
eukprot:1142544-Pelagomonas_calceolata.AAC.2